jgi:small-conductance mechanosensitive channel
MLILIMFRNISELPTKFSWEFLLNYVVISMTITFLSECFADWTKHAFVAKFNSIHPDIYTMYRYLLYEDMKSSHSIPLIYRSEKVVKRMGCIPYALICLVFRCFLQFLLTSNSLGYTILLLGFVFALAFLLKFVTCHLLLSFSLSSSLTLSPSSPLVQKKYNLSILSKLHRYTLFKNRIP